MSSYKRPKTRLSLKVTKTPLMNHGKRNTKQNLNSSHYPSRSDANNAQQEQNKANEIGGDSVSHRSCSNEENESGGDDGDCEADEMDDDSRDEDAMAPSGSAIHGNGNQTGRTKGKKAERSLKISQDRKQKLYPSQFKGNFDTSEDDDDDYSGVDLITDSEEGPTIEQIEEEMIIESEDEPGFSTELVPGFLSGGGGGYDQDHGSFLSDAPYFEQRYDPTDPVTLESEIDTFSSASFFEDNFPPLPTATPHRHVRFAKPTKPLRNVADMDASYSEEDGNPSSSDPKNKLSSDLRPMLDRPKHFIKRLGKKKMDESQNILQNDEHIPPDVQGPGNHDDEQSVHRFQVSDDEPDDRCGSTSGYESDLGETTEEEEVPPSRPQALIRRVSASSMHDVAQAFITSRQQSQTTKPDTRAPTKGSWLADSSKNFATLKVDKRFIIVRPAQREPFLTSNRGNNKKQLQTLELANPVRWPPPGLMVSSELITGLCQGAQGSGSLLMGQFFANPEAFLDVTASDDEDYENNVEYSEDDEDYDFMQFLNYSEDTENDDDVEREEYLESPSDVSSSLAPIPHSDNAPGNDILDTAALYDQNLNSVPLNHSQDSLVEQSHTAFHDDQRIGPVGGLSPLKRRRLSNGFTDGGSFGPSEVPLKRRALNPC